jgi:hypothetical protein
VKHFKAPKESIGYLDAEAAATMIARPRTVTFSTIAGDIDCAS